MVKHSTRNYITAGIFTALLFLYSCFPDNYDFNKISNDFELTPGIATPLAYGTLTIEDLLNKIDSGSYVKQFDDSLLYLTYYEDLMSYPASDIVDIPDQDFAEIYISSDINIPEWLISAMGDTVKFSKEKNGEFVFTHNERIDSINIKTATLNIDVTSTFKQTGILTIHSDNILIDGEPFREVVQISDASGNFSYTSHIPIDGSQIYLDNNNPDTTFLPLKFDLQLINSGNPVLASESCDINMTLSNISFKSVYGYLGDYDILVNSGEVQIDLFGDSLRGGSLMFADPRFNLDVDNSYGVPMQIELSNVSAYSKTNDVSTPIVFNGVNPFTIDAPDLSQVGDTVNTHIEINKDNCNIVDAMATQPNKFTYSVHAITNPGGYSGNQNFVTDSSDLKVGFEVVLPIWINAQGFSLEDTLDFDFEDQFGSDVDIIRYLRLTLDATNGIPMRVNMQMYFADSAYQVIDSLFHDDDLLLAGALLNSEDKVSEPVANSKAIEFTAERINAIKPSKYVMMRANINTKDALSGKYVKFYSYYTVGFKLKLKADLTLNSSTLNNK